MILVIGSSGTIGAELVKQLSAAGEPVRAAYRSRPPKGNVQGARIDLSSGEGLDAALNGVDAVFLLVGDIDDQQAAEIRVVEAAKRAGIKRLVKLSVLAAENEGYSFARMHRAIERAIEGSGIPYTFLRPGSFMQNFITYYGQTIRSEGKFYLPCGDAREAFVDTRDVARVAARALTSPGHEGRAYDLLGPEVLSYADAATRLSAASGREIQYIDTPEDQWRKSMLDLGTPPEQVESLLELHRYVRGGKFPKSSRAIREVTGRDPTSFDQFARDHADAWKA